MMDSFAIVVSFKLRPNMRDRFLGLVKENAAASVREEPDCFRFDLMTSDDADEVVLYEIYTDAAALERHTQTAHYKRFDDATRELVAEKNVRRYSVSENAKAGG